MLPQETGECKGYAFVEFPSIEHAQYFMTAFGKSKKNKADFVTTKYASISVFVTGMFVCARIISGKLSLHQSL
jgi:RNA recognition motif-containing protein